MAKARMKWKSTPGCTGTSANVTFWPSAPMYSRNSGRRRAEAVAAAGRSSRLRRNGNKQAAAMARTTGGRQREAMDDRGSSIDREVTELTRRMHVLVAGARIGDW